MDEFVNILKQNILMRTSESIWSIVLLNLSLLDLSRLTNSFSTILKVWIEFPKSFGRKMWRTEGLVSKNLHISLVVCKIKFL